MFTKMLTVVTFVWQNHDYLGDYFFVWLFCVFQVLCLEPFIIWWKKMLCKIQNQRPFHFHYFMSFVNILTEERDTELVNGYSKE